MGKQYSWAETREQAATSFGGHYPDAELEQEILETFRERPAFVVDAIADITRAFESGRVHSPWLLLRKQLRRPGSELVVTDESECELAAQKAEQWLRVAGLHFDRESEVEDELFGEVTGRLRAWGSDGVLRERLLSLWRELRPRGEQVEWEAAGAVARSREALVRAGEILLERKGFRGFHAPGEEVDEWDVEEVVSA
jgi:hypothetical protein